jgi:hypothetical protein
MNREPSPGVASMEMLFDWELPLIHSPAAAGSEERAGYLADAASLPSAAIWMRASIAYTVFGSTLIDTFAAQVDDFLAVWRDRHGRQKLDELEQQVRARTAERMVDPQRREKELQAVERFFARARGEEQALQA